MNFKKIASKETTLSPLCEGREKTTQEEMIKKYPNGFTVTEFVFVPLVNENTKENELVPVILTAEEEKTFFFGGTLLGRICNAWCVENENNVEQTSAMLKATGGVKMKLTPTKTKSGRNFTAIEIL